MQESERDNRSLDAALRAVAEDEARLNASASVEQRLRAEVRSIALRRRRRYAAALALAAALLIAAAAPAWWMSKRRAGASSTPADFSSPQPAASVAEVSTSFLPLTYSGVPITNGQLVRLEVPRAALASFGLAPPEDLDSPSSGTVLADVLVGEDGLARAVRFVRVAGRAAQKEQKP